MYLLIFSCTFLIPTMGVRASSDVIENNNSGIPDKELYQSILKKLGKKSNEKFTKQEAESIKSLSVYGSRKIKSLKGIKYLKELKLVWNISVVDDDSCGGGGNYYLLLKMVGIWVQESPHKSLRLWP